MSKQERAQRATERAQRIAQERHQRLWNAQVEREEAAIVAQFIADIEAYKDSVAVREP